ncbi:putative F-box protein At5g52610 [Prosopis cineraria]|uniref:putative F-box protein At5g52610 n=1 Tax=Prosopis cineraria TaxID=364024 RepID=UPI00240F205A|nr:putative F-box protein At5g52610 [Prosopis cineraria]
MRQSAADCNTPFLPQEIMRNILILLPVKSLIRFQFVCKHWKNFIKTQSFIQEHLDHSSNENPLLLLQWDDRCDPLNLHMLNYEMQHFEVQPPSLMDSLLLAKIVGCSHGLLCVRDENAVFLSFFLWNPATRVVRMVPRPIYKGFGHIVFDIFGFGFSPIVNDGKIVISHELEFDSVFNRIEVYSLSTGSWKELEIEFQDFPGVDFHGSSPVTANGTMFWSVDRVIECGDEEEIDVVEIVILSFDIAMDVFTLLTLPAGLDFGARGCLTLYKNQLAIFSHTVIGNYESSVIDLWVMEEGVGASLERWSWSKKHSISTDYYICPRGIWLDEIISYYPYEAYVLYLLNINTNESENFDTRRCGYSLSVTFNYAESLLPVGNLHIEDPEF